MAATARFPAATPRRSWQLLLLIVLLLICEPALAKKRSRARNKQVNVKRECERTTCATVHTDDFDNCVLKCQSPECYEDIYGEEELEPGEVDRDRSRKFQSCITSGGPKKKRKSSRQTPKEESGEGLQAAEAAMHQKVEF
eukprot:2580729-Pleurochrysis_carterae.AAC.2